MTRTSAPLTMRSMRRAGVVAVVSAIAALAAGLMVLASQGEAPTTEHPVTVPEKPRTVTISAAMPQPSAHERRLSAMLEEGSMPGHEQPAEVLTDTECSPDAQMISRCRNELRLEDGSRLVLRHPHDMRSIPCLAPGERVLLVPSTA